MRKTLFLCIVVFCFASLKAQTSKYDLVNDFCSKTGMSTIAGWAHPMSDAQSYSVSRSYGDNWNINITYKYNGRYWTCTYHFRMDELGEPQSMSASCGDHTGWFSCFSGMNIWREIIAKLTEEEKNTALRLTGKLLSEITAIDATFSSLYLRWKNWGYYQKY